MNDVGQLPTVAGGFGVVLADPGYHFATWSARGRGKSPDKHYNCSPVEEICSLRVADVMSPHSALFLWLPAPHLPKVEKIMTAWGFAFSTEAWTWVKHNPDTDKFAFGLGLGVTRKNCEHCYLGRRGSPALLNRSTRDVRLGPPSMSTMAQAGTPWDRCQ
jgi:N6-adenosine-specific RNA methylase IME4